MNKRYSLKKLSEREQEEMQYILVEQIEQQCWYGITYLELLTDEILVTLQ
jgi:hypothetical protein